MRVPIVLPLLCIRVVLPGATQIDLDTAPLIVGMVYQFGGKSETQSIPANKTVIRIYTLTIRGAMENQKNTRTSCFY